MRNGEKTPKKQTVQNFDKEHMVDVFRVFKNYTAEHTAATDTAGSEMPYSEIECRGLACKMALFSESNMRYSEAIDRIMETIETLSNQSVKETDADIRRKFSYLISAQMNMLSLFCWLEAFGPHVDYTMASA